MIAFSLLTLDFNSIHIGQDMAHERASTVFKLLDKDGDGELDEEEFVRGEL